MQRITQRFRKDYSNVTLSLSILELHGIPVTPKNPSMYYVEWVDENYSDNSGKTTNKRCDERGNSSFHETYDVRVPTPNSKRRSNPKPLKLCVRQIAYTDKKKKSDKKVGLAELEIAPILATLEEKDTYHNTLALACKHCSTLRLVVKIEISPNQTDDTWEEGSRRSHSASRSHHTDSEGEQKFLAKEVRGRSALPVTPSTEYSATPTNGGRSRSGQSHARSQRDRDRSTSRTRILCDVSSTKPMSPLTDVTSPVKSIASRATPRAGCGYSAYSPPLGVEPFENRGSCSDQKEDVQDTIEDLKASNVELQERLNDQNAELVSFSRKVDQLRQEVLLKQEEVEKYKESNRFANNSDYASKRLEEKLQEKDKSISKLERENLQLQQTVSSLRVNLQNTKECLQWEMAHLWNKNNDILSWVTNNYTNMTNTRSEEGTHLLRKHQQVIQQRAQQLGVNLNIMSSNSFNSNNSAVNAMPQPPPPGTTDDMYRNSSRQHYHSNTSNHSVAANHHTNSTGSSNIKSHSSCHSTSSVTHAQPSQNSPASSRASSHHHRSSSRQKKKRYIEFELSATEGSDDDIRGARLGSKSPAPQAVIEDVSMFTASSSDEMVTARSRSPTQSEAKDKHRRSKLRKNTKDLKSTDDERSTSRHYQGGGGYSSSHARDEYNPNNARDYVGTRVNHLHHDPTIIATANRQRSSSKSNKTEYYSLGSSDDENQRGRSNNQAAKKSPSSSSSGIPTSSSTRRTPSATSATHRLMGDVKRKLSASSPSTALSKLHSK